MTRLIRRAIILLLFLFEGTVHAAADRNSDCAQSKDVDRRIRGCTSVIERGTRVSQKNLSFAYHNRGLAYFRKGEFDRAIADYGRAIEANPKYPVAYYNRGLAYHDSGRLNDAIADYTRAIELNPRNADAYHNRGLIYFSRGALDRAIADYARAIEANPKHAVAYYHRGLAHYNAGKLDDAIADYTRAIELNSQDADAYNNRGLAYNGKGELDRAIADYERAIEINPQYAKAYNNRGNAYSTKGKNDRAIADFTKALTIEPKNVFALRMRAKLYEDKFDNGRALADLDQAVAVEPENVPVLQTRAKIHVSNQDFKLALVDLNTLLEIDPKNKAARNSMGNVCYAMGYLNAAEKPRPVEGSQHCANFRLGKNHEDVATISDGDIVETDVEIVDLLAPNDGPVSAFGKKVDDPNPEAYVARVGGSAKIFGPGNLRLDGRAMMCGMRPTVMDPSLDSPAAWAKGYNVLNPNLIINETSTVKYWLYSVQCGHQFRGPDRRVAECFGVQSGQKQGWLTDKGVDEICDFVESTSGSMGRTDGNLTCKHIRECFAATVGK